MEGFFQNKHFILLRERWGWGCDKRGWCWADPTRDGSKALVNNKQIPVAKDFWVASSMFLNLNLNELLLSFGAAFLVQNKS